MDLTSLAQLGINGPPPPPEDEDKKKRLDDILGEIGLHPAQIEARKSLGIEGPNNPSGNIADEIVPKAPQLIETLKQQQDTPIVKSAQPATTISAPTPAKSALIPDVDPQISNARDSVLGSQNEARRLVKTGSGISQIHNPFLRGIARAGDIALTSLFPAIAMQIPGTELHHDRLYQAEENNIKHGMVAEDTAAQTYDRLHPAADKNPTPLSIWVKQHPDGKIEDFWKEQAAAQGVGKTPEELLYNFLTSPEGGNMKPPDAYAAIQKEKSENKPDNAAKHKQDMEALLQKAFPRGIDPDDMADVRKLAQSIQKSAYLTPPEKSQLTAWYAMNASPASQGMSAEIRGTNLQKARIATYLDTKNGQLVSMNAQDFDNAQKSEPGRYVDAKNAAPALQKESIFQDIYFNVDNVRDALKTMTDKGIGFTTAQRAQMSMMLRNSDPKSALGPFLTSGAGATLGPEQVEYVTALASLQENALALRGIAGFGTGSDELRAAILKALPGAGTPDAVYANRQLDLFLGTVNRLHKGVPQLSPPENQPAGHPKGTLTRAQVEAVAKANGISYEDAKKDAEAHNFEVKE